MANRWTTDINSLQPVSDPVNTTWKTDEPYKPLSVTVDWTTNPENENYRFPYKFVRPPVGEYYSNEGEVNKFLLEMPLSKKHAELNKIAQYRLWIDPKGKIYPLKDSPTHAEWIEKNLEFLNKKYRYNLDYYTGSYEDGSYEFYYRYISALVAEGWTRIGDIWTGHGVGTQVKDLRNISQFVIDFLLQQDQDAFTVEDFEQSVELTKEDLIGGQSHINRALRLAKPVYHDAAKEFSLSKTALAEPGVWIDLNGKVYNLKLGEVHSFWPLDNIALLNKEYNFGEEMTQLGYNLEWWEERPDYIVDTMIERGWVRVVAAYSGDASFNIELKSMKNIPAFLDGFIAEHYKGGIIEVEDSNRTIHVDDPFPTLQTAINEAWFLSAPIVAGLGLSKQAFTQHGLWVAPDGKVYDARKGGGLGTHGEWVHNNEKLLKRYGIVDVVKRDYFEVAREMLEKGWARVGDTAHGSRGMVGVEVADIRNIPTYIDNALVSFMEDGQSLIVADLSNKWAEVTYPFKSLQGAVRRALRGYRIETKLRKFAVKQQDVVDFYLLSLLPTEYLSSDQVDPEHYDALKIFQIIVVSLRDEYIKRGLHELKDEALTTKWVKKIPNSEMSEELKPYYKYHDEPFAGYYDPSGESREEFEYDYNCESCGEGLPEEDVHSFGDSFYCDSCYEEVVYNVVKEEVFYCSTHNVFVTDNSELVDYVSGGNVKVESIREHPEGSEHQLVPYNEGVDIWNEVKENVKKQLKFRFMQRQQPSYKPVQSSLKHIAVDDNADGWWEAPTNFHNFTSLDFYKIFKYAPWKHLYGGPLWAEVARTIYEMENTTDLQKLVVLIDHFHDLGHNTGKLLDKFPEWHQWFKNLLDMKAQKNSMNYLLNRASRPVKDLVLDYLRTSRPAWREEEPVMAASLELSKYDQKKSATSEFISYWVDPSGKVFQSSDTHAYWVLQNIDMLETKYGYNISLDQKYIEHPEEYSFAEFEDDDVYDVVLGLIEKGWTRVFSTDHAKIFQIKSIENPSNVVQSIYKDIVTGEESSVMVEDLQRKTIQLNPPYYNFVGDVNRALRTEKTERVASPKLLPREKLYDEAQTYTDKELDKILTEQHEIDTNNEGGFASRDFTDNSTDYPKPEEQHKSPFTLDQLTRPPNGTLPSYEVTFFMSTPRGDDTH